MHHSRPHDHQVAVSRVTIAPAGGCDVQQKRFSRLYRGSGPTSTVDAHREVGFGPAALASLTPAGDALLNRDLLSLCPWFQQVLNTLVYNLPDCLEELDA